MRGFYGINTIIKNEDNDDFSRSQAPAWERIAAVCIPKLELGSEEQNDDFYDDDEEEDEKEWCD